ncbi:vWA domain-containing protein [Actinophytocola sediminis]
MDQPAQFSVRVSQVNHLAPADDQMHAVLVVTADGTGPGAVAPELAQVIIIDCSGSMSFPPTKLTAAQRATRIAIGLLPDGTRFAVVAGTQDAEMVYPPEQGLAVADPATREAARNAVAKLYAGGSTAIGEWLRLTRKLLASRPDAVRHAILLTDGQNNRGSNVLEHELAACAPVFTCDSRGIGTDWEPKELLRIAESLHGTADAIREHHDLTDEFRAMTESAMGKLVPEVRIRVGTTAHTGIAFLRQTYPTMSMLDGLAAGQRATAFPTGSWGPETREFHLCLRVDYAGEELGEDIRLARVDVQLRRPGSTEFVNAGAPALVFVCWTGDLKLSSRMDRRVAHHLEQTELRDAIEHGCTAHDANDLATATTEWGRAVALATQLGNDQALTRLGRLVEIIDPVLGVVRIRESVRPVDLYSVEMGSVISSRSPDEEPDQAGAGRPTVSGPDRECPACHERATARFCGACGYKFDA